MLASVVALVILILCFTPVPIELQGSAGKVRLLYVGQVGAEERLLRVIEGGLGSELAGFVPGLLAAGVVAVEWLVLWQLYRRRIILRV